ncbi:Quinoprotein glucose dehydrogenase B precursor [Planctomycetes bacterium MalM25]|nr:Quinoprotein glucose dehydrogenase B precursor [Planctomycetes bacterium MalM25]
MSQSFTAAIDRTRSLPAAVSATLLALLAAAAPSIAQTLPAANPISAVLPSTSFSLQLEEVIRIPDSSSGNNRFARIEQISPAIDGSGEIFVSDQRGKVYTFTPGDTNPSEFFNFAAVIPSFKNNNNQSGLRGFAFHPNAFGDSNAPGYRKMYTAHEIDTNANESHLSVVSEWSLNGSGVPIVSSRRDVLTQSQPRGDHNIGKVGFNPNLSPGDADYGNLYISFGDGGNYRTDAGDTTLNPNGQNTTNFLGSMLRINPLQDGGSPYSVPADNPFVNQGGIDNEIWAYGLRNPHQFSWDTGGNGDLLIADIGQSNIEEVNLGVAGANYGWSTREGTFDMTGKLPGNPIQADVLPGNHPNDAFTYPVAQYDHDFNNAGQDNAAIAGGFVYRGSLVPELKGKYIFGNFGSSTQFQDIYVVDVDQLQLQDDFTNLDRTSTDAFLAPMEILSLVDDQDNPVQLLDLVRDASGIGNQSRTDMRFGIGSDGEIYISSKKDGWIRRFTSTLKPGDYNRDGVVDAADYTVWRDGDSPDNSQAGYELWRDNYGAANAAANSAAIPEPGSALLLGFATLLLAMRRSNAT